MSPTAHIRSNIAAIEQRLSMMYVEEREASRILDSICAQKLSLEARRAVLDAQTKPVHWLPVEILLDIFDVLLYADHSAPLTQEYVMRPVVISQVCHQWRSLAISTPSLWFRIPVHNRMATESFLKRSKGTLLELVYLEQRSSWYSTRPLLLPVIPRVQSIRWQRSSYLAYKHLQTLIGYGMTSFVNLHVFELDDLPPNTHQTVSGAGPYPPLDVTRFPALVELYLRAVDISPKPAYVFPTLVSLRLDHRDMRLSSLFQLLMSMPNLETLIMIDMVPKPDIVLRSVRDQLGQHPQIQWAPKGPRSVHLNDVVAMPRLKHVDWSFAPPWDTRVLFFLLEARNIRSFAVCLGPAAIRWHTGYASGDPFAALVSTPLSMPALEDLSIECVDTEALREGFRKMNFPLLAKLHITYLPPLETPYDLPLLPRHESIFREPRMLHLTHLKLAHFTLDVDEGKTMLRYMPALTQLMFVDCIRVGEIICALSGGTCDNRHENPASVWICPRLELLRIVDSPDLKFSCLQGLVRARYQSSVAPISCPSTPSKAGSTITSNSPRLVKPLRRRLRDVDATQDPASSSASRTGPRTTASWSPYAVVRPSQLQSVSVEGCRRVSELEAVSLTYEFPSLRVKWEA